MITPNDQGRGVILSMVEIRRYLAVLMQRGIGLGVDARDMVWIAINHPRSGEYP